MPITQDKIVSGLITFTPKQGATDSYFHALRQPQEIGGESVHLLNSDYGFGRTTGKRPLVYEVTGTDLHATHDLAEAAVDVLESLLGLDCTIDSVEYDEQIEATMIALEGLEIRFCTDPGWFFNYTARFVVNSLP